MESRLRFTDFSFFLPCCLGANSEGRLLPNHKQVLSLGDRKNFKPIFSERASDSVRKLIWWFRRKQKERRVPGAGFRLKQCQANWHVRRMRENRTASFNGIASDQPAEWRICIATEACDRRGIEKTRIWRERKRIGTYALLWGVQALKSVGAELSFRAYTLVTA
jgi:hypothetical protein